MSMPRPNRRVDRQSCQHCFTEWFGVEKSPCPQCGAAAGSMPIVIPPWMSWSLLAAWVTAAALAITGLWILVTR